MNRTIANNCNVNNISRRNKRNGCGSSNSSYNCRDRIKNANNKQHVQSINILINNNKVAAIIIIAVAVAVTVDLIIITIAITLMKNNQC